ncbi:MAG: hypothetical protein L0H83_00210 [Salinisphaera sp.]|nr:hypothetical protein [Salinisphaera sp.]
MSEQDQLPNIALDETSLFREETISDGKAGYIRRLTPVTAEGDDDSSRAVQYEGNTTIMTPAGGLPIQFALEVDGLKAALAAFPQAAKDAIERTMNELHEMQRQQSSSLYVPGQGGGGGMPQGGPGGGGRIQL